MTNIVSVTRHPCTGLGLTMPTRGLSSY
jgi:hypothetical protein